jgi:hypothetical protein
MSKDASWPRKAWLSLDKRHKLLVEAVATYFLEIQFEGHFLWDFSMWGNDFEDSCLFAS